MNPRAYRLPGTVVPLRYDLSLRADPNREEFNGSVTIHLEMREPGRAIALHSKDLQLAEAVLQVGERAIAGHIELDPDREVATLTFEEEVPAGEAKLQIAFNGKVSKGFEGLYIAVDGPDRLMCTMSFATAARAIFPCFDEPSFKARFAYEVTTSVEHGVLTNSPLVGVEEAEGGLRKWTFAATKPMSTYLVALAIGDVAAEQAETVNGTPLRVWARSGKEHMGRFALAYTQRLLPWYEDYFGLPYHWDKYDQLAVPGTSVGAMENTGLVMFQQGLLLMDPQTVSWSQEKSVAHVVAHEFAHMWFGNLATIAWWDDVWLSEAFAEWLSNKVVDTLTPEYRIWDDFQRWRAAALETDALASTHSIYNKVETPAEALEMFDTITYEKGCAVLRMLENFLGEDTFRAGIQIYMREFAERNAAGPDLWRNLEHAANLPVTRMMESWVTQPGYPLLEVQSSGTEAGTSRVSLRITQGRFYSDPSAGGGEQIWTVPVVLRYEDSSGVHEVRHLLEGREGEVQIDVAGEIKWLHANAGAIGFYRQRLDDSLMERLLTHMGQLSPSEQVGILGDQWALARAGKQPITAFMDTLAALVESPNYTVAEGVVSYLHTIERMVESFGDEGVAAGFRQWVERAFTPAIEQLGYSPKPGESRDDEQRRVSVVDALATMAHGEEALKQASVWQAREAEDPASVDANLAPVYVRANAIYGDADLFEQYLRVYTGRKAASAAPQVVNRYRQGFASFQAPALVSRALGLLDDGTIPQEAVVPGLVYMLQTGHGQVQAWEYIKSRWPHLRDTAGAALSRLVEAVEHLPVSMRDDVTAFFDANLDGLADMSYARALEAMDQEAEFRNRTRDELVGWFVGQSA